MKSKIIIVCIAVVFLLISFVMWKSSRQITEDQKTILYNLQGKQYRLLIADTPGKWEKGLMNVRQLENSDGMIFIFPEKQYQNFWNKNTFMDLDVYWIENKQVVGKSFLPSIERSKQRITVSSPKMVNIVIELPAGT